MDEEQRYKFDCTGWLALDGALDRATCARLLHGGDAELAQRTLLRHLSVSPLLDDLFENGWSRHPGAVQILKGVDGYRVDSPPRLMDADPAGGFACGWSGGNVRPGGGRSELSLAREYTHRYGERHCQGLLVVVALADVAHEARVELVPCSHKNEVPTPASVHPLFGDRCSSTAATLPQHTVHCPPLKQGTVLLLAATVLRRLPAQRAPLLCVELAGNSARPTPGGGASQQQLDAGWKNFAAAGAEERPAWARAGRLDALQRAVLERAGVARGETVTT
jgi:hypothetical protein